MKKIAFYILIYSLISCSKISKKQVVIKSDLNLTLKNGVLYYKKVPFNGNIQNYFKSGDLQSDIEYIEGRKHGTEKQWHTNGNIAIERHYSKGKKIGVHKAWWVNSNPKFVYHFNDSGAYNGSVKEWYVTGQPYRNFNYINCKEAGSQKLWKENGTIKANYEVRNGDRFGLIGLKKCFTVSQNSNEVN